MLKFEYTERNHETPTYSCEEYREHEYKAAKFGEVTLFFGSVLTIVFLACRFIGIWLG